MTRARFTLLAPFAMATVVSLSLFACAQGAGSEAPPPPPDDLGAPTPPDGRSTQSAKLPGDDVVWKTWPAQNSKSGSAWGTALTDIAQHLPSSYGDTYWDSDLITAGHETTHGIHAHLRNYKNDTGKRANALYVLDGRFALIVEPGIRKSDVAPYVPKSLRASRFAMYITGQVEWDDTPLYVFDEWNAYVNGGAVGVELVKRGLWKGGWRDGVAGQLEFTVYAIAVAMAVQAKDPAYLAANPQLREFLGWNARRAMSIYREGSKLPTFQWADQDAYWERMKTSADAEAFRAFSRSFFGAAFADAVLFGDGTISGGDPPDAGPGDAGPTVDAGPADTGSGADAGPTTDAGTSDADGDGIADGVDLCGGTPAGAPVWTSGEWIGCGAGQHRDGGGGADGDGDGIADAKDQCKKTPAGVRVWPYGEWMGCAAGEHRD